MPSLNSHQGRLPFIIICIVLLLLSSNILAQSKEIPITTNSEKARTLFIEGRDMMENLQLVKASELFDEAITTDPNFSMAHIYRALTGVGGFNIVRLHIDSALKNLETITDSERDLVLLNISFIDGNQLKQKVYLEKLLTNFPKDKRVQTWAGIYYYTTKDFETAKLHLEKAVDLDKNFATAYNLLGYTEFELNDEVKAERAMQKYISLTPDSPNPYDSYGEILLKSGRYDESIKQYNLALTKDPTFTSAIIGIGNNFIFKNNFSEARINYQKCFDVATNINNKLEALTWMSTSYIHEGKIDQAISTLNTRIDLARTHNLVPDIVITYTNGCFILTEAGRFTEGLKMLDEATKVMGENVLPEETSDALTVQTNLAKCYTLISANRLAEAQQNINSMLQIINSRDNISELQQLNANLAMLELKRGDYQKAITHFTKADVTSELNQYYMGLTYEKMGNKIKATEYFTKVKNSRNNNIGLAVVRSRAVD
ncbi:MAG: tetratricopeptide repeat protein [bacterium]